MPPHEQNWCVVFVPLLSLEKVGDPATTYGDIMFDMVILAIVEICQCGYNV